MSLPKPRKNCPYCGGFNLQVKQCRSRGTWFVECECTATGPSMAKSPQEACELFEKRATTIEFMSFKELYEFMEPPEEVR